ncbi:MAG: 3-hydroxyacyl-CoA dehydrogenase NAD-binding domain-containing protein [Psychroflexus sp.]|nr:3-hydroxyacyl-CoA dehydrogenase NAD-binding domain-containing protein [Psychroflexus sp.]
MNISIIGSGTMGRGIAQVAAQSGNQVKVFDKDADALKRSEEALDKILNRLIEKDRIDTHRKDEIQKNIHYVNDLADLADADLTIEAIVEDLEVKQHVFKTLESHQREDAIIASNTSSLSIASIASCLENPQRFLGIHFFNPAPLMALVEIIPAVQTDKAVFDKTFTTIENWNKTAVKAKDTPGFIVNRVARPFYGEALRIFEETAFGITQDQTGIATIDWAMKELGGFKMGPFQLMDFIGNDINYTVSETVFKAFYYDPRYKPSLTQKRYVEAGYLGKKSGKGFYDHNEEAAIQPDTDTSKGQKILDRILVMLINEAADALHMNVASATDIDLAMTKGVRYPKGLLAWANEKGINWCVDKMDKLYDTYHEDRYRCSPILRKMDKQNITFDV